MIERTYGRWVLLMAAGLGLVCAGVATPVSAYSSYADYVRPIEEGGGGGRLFSGSPADPHSCDVCHRGGPSAPLEILGLPVRGYVPGQTYEIAVRWPPEIPHVALMAEFTTLAGAPAGITALVPYAMWELGERCESGDFPAADICRLGGSGTGCCRDLDPDRDACSYPEERSVFWVLDCGSRSARLRWTAPAEGAGDVWFGMGMVNSNLMNDALGDGTTIVRQRLRPAGTGPEVPAAVGNCRASQHGGASSTCVLLATCGLFAWIGLRIRRRVLR